jgi:hypothetical protein
MVLVGMLLFSLSLIGVLELPFTLFQIISVPSWVYLLGAIAFLSWCLDD